MFRLLQRACLTQTATFRPPRTATIPRFNIAMSRFRHIYRYRDRFNIAYRPQPGTHLPTGWSCDWKSWEFNDIDIFQDGLQEEYKITSFIEPLAHEVPSPTFVFYSGGDYYFHFPAATPILKRFTGTFKSHDDFVLRFDAEREAGAWVEVEMPPLPPGTLTVEEIRAHPRLNSSERLGAEELKEIIDEMIKKR